MATQKIYYDLLDDVDEAARNGRYETESGNILFDPIRPTKRAIELLRRDGFTVSYFFGFPRFNFIRISWRNARFGRAERIKKQIDRREQHAENYVQQWDIGK